MQRPAPRPPINQADLQRLALRYVEKFATSRGRLEAYLKRKLRERGADGETDPAAIADAMVARGYVDDAAYAEAKSAGLARRGYGRQRVVAALRHAGIDQAGVDEAAERIDPVAAALALARRRRIGPWAREAAGPDQQRRQMAQLVRAGHAPGLSRKIVALPPGEEPNPETLE
jgi:regulatory protein